MNKKFVGYGLLLAALIVAPFFGAYPIFVMKLLCFALFASAFNLLLGYTGLLSFGHAAFFGGSAYVAGHAMKVVRMECKVCGAASCLDCSAWPTT